MKNGVRIARIFGINIGVDWSWLLIFTLITWNLATVFSNLHPDWGVGLNWGVALTAAILFFLSVLLHELAHSLVAIARGMKVTYIKLFLFGGVSNIEREPPSATTEFLMALVGPLTSILLGVILVLAAGFSIDETITNPNQIIGQLGPLTTLLMWLGSINIFLGFFNLVPGFPLDGGRILRSIFWGVTNDLRRATRWASWIGQGIAWLMIFAGISMIFGVRIPVLGGGIINGMWLAFIGWFLHSSAVASYRQVVIRDLLEDVPVSRMMRSNPPTVPGTTTVDDLVHNTIMQTDEHAFPVIEGEKLIGMVTLEDVREVSRDAWTNKVVREIMTPVDELVSVQPDEDAAEALHKLQSRDVHLLPVIRNGSLAGVLRRRDIIKWLRLESEEFESGALG